MTTPKTTKMMVCDRRLSRAARYILFRHLQQVIKYAEENDSRSVGGKIITEKEVLENDTIVVNNDTSTDPHKNIKTNQIFSWWTKSKLPPKTKLQSNSLQFNKSFWDIVDHFLVLPTATIQGTNPDTKNRSIKDENEDYKEKKEDETGTKQPTKICSTFFENDIYEQDEKNYIQMVVMKPTKHNNNDDGTKFINTAWLYNAIPGKYTPPPKRYAHKYRSWSSSSRSISTLPYNQRPLLLSLFQSNNKKESISNMVPLDQIMVLEQESIGIGLNNNSNKNNRHQEDIHKKKIIWQPEQHSPWYRDVRTNQIFQSRYYLDLHLDRYNNANHSNNNSHINNTSLEYDNDKDYDQEEEDYVSMSVQQKQRESSIVQSSTTMMCPATDWCGTIIPKQVCYDTALYLEPYYGDRAINRYILQRMYKKESDLLSSSCTMEHMESIAQTCRDIVQTCVITPPSTTTTTKTTKTTTASYPTSDVVRDSLLASLCTIHTCHSRLYRLLQHHTISTTIGTMDTDTDPLFTLFSTSTSHDNWSDNNHSHSPGTSSLDIGYTGIFVIVTLALYYSYNYYIWMKISRKQLQQQHKHDKHATAFTTNSNTCNDDGNNSFNNFIPTPTSTTQGECRKEILWLYSNQQRTMEINFKKKE